MANHVLSTHMADKLFRDGRFDAGNILNILNNLTKRSADNNIRPKNLNFKFFDNEDIKCGHLQ